jgi:hypothetical protein
MNGTFMLVVTAAADGLATSAASIAIVIKIETTLFIDHPHSRI